MNLNYKSNPTKKSRNLLNLLSLLSLLSLFSLSLLLTGCLEDNSLKDIVEKTKNVVDTAIKPEGNLIFGEETGRSAESEYDSSKYPEELRLKINKVVKENPENQILQRDTLCKKEVFESTVKKISDTLEKNGYGQDFKFGIGVTVKPQGTKDNMIWRELWAVTTPKGVVAYPLIFVEDGKGKTTSVPLKPFTYSPTASQSSDSENQTQTTEDTTDNFFNSIKPMLSKNNATKRVRNTILYFSASWCGPCQQFTPLLVTWYKTIKTRYPDTEIVFVSCDKSKAQFEEYSAKMPWSHLKFESKKDPAVSKFAARGIPFLVLVNENGVALTEQKHASEVLPKIEEIITGKSASNSSFKASVFE